MKAKVYPEYVAAYLPAGTKQRLTRVAVEQGMSASMVVRMGVLRQLRRIEADNQEERED